MDNRITPPDWGQWNPSTGIIVEDMKLFYETYTGPIGEAGEENTKEITDLDGRVTALEQQKPTPGGKGAYLNLGGTPGRYPLASEMASPEEKETGFLVVARPDGIYFYNPQSKQLIPPKIGGGTMAVHAEFPQYSGGSNVIKHNTRQGRSGIYTAEVDKIELDHIWDFHDTCKVLVVATDDGNEHQTAFHPDGIATRVFRNGDQLTPWRHIQGGIGGGDGGGNVDLSGIENRLSDIEAEQILQNASLDMHFISIEDHEERIARIEAGGVGGTSTFVGLLDTPDDYTGAANKTIRVNADGDGLEFIEGPEVEIMDKLEKGDLPIKWNNLKQKIAASSADISAEQITENAFTLGLSSAANKFVLPNIVDADTSPLPALSVREGRLTIISQQGTGSRTVELTNGCKFSSAGTTTTSNMKIPAGQAWILLPAIYANKDKVWSLIGTFSSNNQTYDSYAGFSRVGARSVTANSIFSTSQINEANLIHCEMVSHSGTTTRYTMLPEIQPWAYNGVLADTECRLGKRYTLYPSSTGAMIARSTSAQKWLVNGETIEGDRNITRGVMETFIAVHHNNEYKWMLVSRCKADGSPVELDALSARVTALENDSGNGGGGGPGVDLGPVNDRLDALENKPHPTYFDLTNTPSSGRGGELVGYNAGGGTLISYKRVAKMEDLEDTPETIVGNSNKVLTVKNDATGYEFREYPLLAPLQTQITSNREMIEHQAIVNDGYSARIFDLEATRDRTGHFPKVYADGNMVKTDGRVGVSGMYTAMPGDINLAGGAFPAYKVCKMLVAVTEDGEELQTVLSEFAIAARLYTKGSSVAAWNTSIRSGPIYRGVWDPQSQVWPYHANTDSMWDVAFENPATVSHTWSGRTWKSGDRLLYVLATNSYAHQNGSMAVTSVNGKVGAVVLNAQDIGGLTHIKSAVKDCNDLKAPGSHGVAGGSANWCFGTTAGAIIVFHHSNSYLTQLACSAADNKMRVRTCNKDNWSAWQKIYSELEKPTADEVKAVNLNYGVGAAGKDIPDMSNPEIKGGMFNAGGSTAGAYVNYMPFMQAARAGGADGTGQVFQIQANHANKKLAYRTRDKGVWNDWIEPYSSVNKPTALDVSSLVNIEYDADVNTVKDGGIYRLSTAFTNGPTDALGGQSPTYSQMLHVGGQGDTNWQMIGDFRGKNLWWRGYNDSFLNGGTWNRIFHSGNIPTFDELNLPYLARNRYDVRDYGVVGDGVTDDTDNFVRACNTVHGLNGTLTAPGNMRIRLAGVNRTVTVRCNMDLNNAVIDMNDFQGMIMFSRKVIDPITIRPPHALIDALCVEDKLQGGELRGWKDIPDVEDSYFMINTEEPLFSYRGGVKNRCEYNKIGRWGQLESMIRYPMDPKKISRIMYWPMEKQMTVAQNIVFDLGANDLQSPNVRIRTSNFTAKNWRFIQKNFINENKNPTVLAVERSANIVMEDIYFQWATHTTATTGFTYNVALNDNYNVSLKRVNGTGDGWGSTGSNNSRKVYFEQCNLSRIDFHEPMHEFLSLKDCHIGSWGVLATAMGDINIDGCTLFRKRNPVTVDRNGFIRSRTDSGFCDGNISLRNVTIVTDQPGVSQLIEHQNDAPESDFIVPGSPVDFCFWKNITLDNVKFQGPPGSSLNLYPQTKCRDMAESGMRWPYALNITNCTGGDLILKGTINETLLPYKNVLNPDRGFIGAIPNHVINVTESNLQSIDLQDVSDERRFVVALNVDNVNPAAQDARAPGIKTKLAGSVSVRNTTFNSINFDNPLAPLYVVLDGCKVIHTGHSDNHIINGKNDGVELSTINSMLSTAAQSAMDSVKQGAYRNNRYYVVGVKQELE